MRLPVYQLEEEMPYDEFINWHLYFNQRPVGWREDLRASYIMQAQGASIKATEVFPSLQKVFEQKHEKQNPMASLRGSFLFNQLASAKGGENLSILKEL